MGRELVVDLMDQYRRSLGMLTEEIGRFGPAHWTAGVSQFLTPAHVSMHIADTLDYYFSGRPGRQYTWGHRFGGGWWELAAEELPDSHDVLTYIAEISARITNELEAMDDQGLARPFDIDDSGATFLGHYVYALRHTMHHQGELSALAVHNGLAGGSWA